MQFPWSPWLKAPWTGAGTTHTHMDRTHSLHTLYINTVTITWLVPSASSAIAEFGIKLLFWRYLREGEQTRVPRENPWQPPVSHIRRENPTSRMGIDPSPSNICDKLAWPRAWAASDPLSYRLPLCHPDMTFTVDWALNNNYLSIYRHCGGHFM